MNNIKKIQIFFEDIKKVSKLTNTSNKKLRIFFSAVISNLIVLLDIYIILSFTYIFTKDQSLKNQFTYFVLDNLKILPLLVVLRFLSIYFDKLNIYKLRFSIEENLRKNLIKEIFDKGNYSNSDAYFYLNTISTQVASFYGTLAVFIGSGLQIIAYFSYLFLNEPKTVTFLFAIILVLYFPTIFLVKYGRKYAHKTYLSSQDVSNDIENVVDNLFLIKILNLTKLELEKFYSNLVSYYKSSITNLKLGTINAIMPNFLTMFSLGFIVAFTTFIQYLTLDFIGVSLRLFQSLGILNSNLHLVSAYHVYLEKLYELENNKALINKLNHKIEKSKDNLCLIELNNVNFQYFNSKFPIFENLNLKVNKNEHLVLTGPNGSGKSTLMGLIAGIYYPDKGSVLLRSENIGYVGTKPLILNSTLIENLTYGTSTSPSEDEIVKLLNKFKVFNETEKIDLKMKVSNRSLSSGQMQKISFIRAFINKVEILLLDEAFSNIDQNSKDTISEILNQEKVTIINSTHKVSDFAGVTSHIEIQVNDNNRILNKII